MKTAVFKISEMIAELEKELNIQNGIWDKLHKDKKEKDTEAAIESARVVMDKLRYKLTVLREYKDLTVTVRKYSARQKNIIEQTLLNPQAGSRGMKVTPDIPAFKKKAIQFGVIGMEPRRLDMVKVSEATTNAPEIWQISDAALDSDEFGWELQELLIEMIDEINPKNWN